MAVLAIAEGGITPPRPLKRISFLAIGHFLHPIADIELARFPTQRRKAHNALRLGLCKDPKIERDHGQTQRPKVQKPELVSVLCLDELCWPRDYSCVCAVPISAGGNS